jgi:hypothetical protein
MRILFALICMMISAYAQPIDNKFKKEIKNMDQIERAIRGKAPHRVRGK